MRKIDGKVAALLVISLAAAPLFAAEPEPPKLVFAFEELVTLGAATQVGQTPYGSRTIIPITGGSFAGPALRGFIVPGAWDWQLRRADGCTDLRADYMLRTDDGVTINVLNRGAICPAADGKFAAVRTNASFEAPLGKYQWLGQAAFVGTLEPATEAGKPAVRIRFYKAQ